MSHDSIWTLIQTGGGVRSYLFLKEGGECSCTISLPFGKRPLVVSELPTLCTTSIACADVVNQRGQGRRTGWLRLYDTS